MYFISSKHAIMDWYLWLSKHQTPKLFWTTTSNNKDSESDGIASVDKRAVAIWQSEYTFIEARQFEWCTKARLKMIIELSISVDANSISSGLVVTSRVNSEDT